MAYKYQTINLTSQDFEQGTIDGNGIFNESTLRIRSNGIYQIEGLDDGANNIVVSVAATTSSGKNIKIAYKLYDSNNNFLGNDNWQSVPGDYTLWNTTKKIRLLIGNIDDTEISPDDLISISLIISTSYYWEIKDSYPKLAGENSLIKVLSEPTPYSAMVQKHGKYPVYPYLNLLDMGAFVNATNLRYVRIPETVKKIGEYAFRNTALISVTIARDCEYYPTSFPDGCVINFY
jgi:hypothetical protein